MKIPLESSVKALSRHLQEDLLLFRGKLTQAPMPPFRPQLLIPLMVLVAAGIVLASSPKARNSLVMKLAVLLSTRLLQSEVQKEVSPNE